MLGTQIALKGDLLNPTYELYVLSPQKENPMPQHTEDDHFDKQELINALRQILNKGTAGTQEEICKALEEEGFPVNQSKISRLLRKVGAIKVNDAGGHFTYHLPLDPAPPVTNCPINNLVVEVVANEHTVVMHTSPGSASLIARILDHHRMQLGILGTVAGDDTIFVSPASIEDLAGVVSKIKELVSI